MVSQAVSSKDFKYSNFYDTGSLTSSKYRQSSLESAKVYYATGGKYWYNPFSGRVEKVLGRKEKTKPGLQERKISHKSPTRLKIGETQQTQELTEKQRKKIIESNLKQMEEKKAKEDYGRALKNIQEQKRQLELQERMLKRQTPTQGYVLYTKTGGQSISRNKLLELVRERKRKLHEAEYRLKKQKEISETKHEFREAPKLSPTERFLEEHFPHPSITEQQLRKLNITGAKKEAVLQTVGFSYGATRAFASVPYLITHPIESIKSMLDVKSYSRYGMELRRYPGTVFGEFSAYYILGKAGGKITKPVMSKVKLGLIERGYIKPKITPEKLTPSFQYEKFGKVGETLTQERGIYGVKQIGKRIYKFGTETVAKVKGEKIKGYTTSYIGKIKGKTKKFYSTFKGSVKSDVRTGKIFEGGGKSLYLERGAGKVDILGKEFIVKNKKLVGGKKFTGEIKSVGGGIKEVKEIRVDKPISGGVVEIKGKRILGIESGKFAYEIKKGGKITTGYGTEKVLSKEIKFNKVSGGEKYVTKHGYYIKEYPILKGKSKVGLPRSIKNFMFDMKFRFDKNYRTQIAKDTMFLRETKAQPKMELKSTVSTMQKEGLRKITNVLSSKEVPELRLMPIKKKTTKMKETTIEKIKPEFKQGELQSVELNIKEITKQKRKMPTKPTYHISHITIVRPKVKQKTKVTPIVSISGRSAIKQTQMQLQKTKSKIEQKLTYKTRFDYVRTPSKSYYIMPPFRTTKPKGFFKTSKVNFFTKKKIKKKPRVVAKTLYADILSVMESRIKYGKATHPLPTKHIWKRGEKSLFTNIPTVEILKGGIMKKRKRRKRKKR